MNKLIIGGILLGAVVALALGYAFYQTYITNPRVIRELLDNPQDKTAAHVM